MNKKILILSVVFGVLFLIISIIDMLVKDVSDNQQFWLNFFEIIFASSTSLTLSINLRIENKINTVKTKNSNFVVSNQNNGDNNTSISILNNNDPATFIKAVKDILIPYQQENVENIVKKSVDALGNEILGTPLNKDFVIKYLNESVSITEEEIQDIWVKLLLQENKITGSISKRTLDIVKNLYPSEAILFEDVAKFSNAYGIIYKDLCASIPFIEISKLQDIGLLKSNDLLSENLVIDANNKFGIIEGNLILIIKNNNISKTEKITYQCYVLTAEGKELKNALNINMKSENFIEFCRRLKTENINKRDLTFSLHNIINKKESDIAYDEEDILN